MNKFKIEETLSWYETNYLCGILTKEEKHLYNQHNKHQKENLSTKSLNNKIDELHRIMRKLDVNKSKRYNW